MRQSIVPLLVLVSPIVAGVQNPVGDQVAIYDLVLADVARSIATPAMMPAHLPALVPFVFQAEELPPWEPGPQASRMSDTVLRELKGRRPNMVLCEPTKDHACRGSVRGGVLRVTKLLRNRPDTVSVSAQLTQARAEQDPTVMVPRPLYYQYVLVRDASGWRILEAHRASLDLRTA